MVYDKEQIEQLLEGYWYREPKEDWYVDNIDINKQQMKRYHQKGYKTLFIAMDSETWHKDQEILAFMLDGKILIKI